MCPMTTQLDTSFHCPLASQKAMLALPDWVFSGSASLLPCPFILTPGSLVWDLRHFVVKAYSHDKEKISCKRDGFPQDSETGGLTISQCSKFRGQSSHTGVAHSQHIPSVYLLSMAFCHVCPLETLTLPSIST